MARKNKKFTETEKAIYRLGYLNGEDRKRRKNVKDDKCRKTNCQ